MLCRILNWINKSVEQLPVKNPEDWSLTKSSTVWKIGWYCSDCGAWISVNEYCNSVCDTCGKLVGFERFDRRSCRMIWNGEKWVVQIRYQGNKYEINDDVNIYYSAE